MIVREIKFRAWDKKANQMVCWKDISRTNILGMLVNNNNRDDSLGILMQFTGLLDKNGVYIYEGDIVCNEGFKEEVKWDEFYGWVVSDEQMLGEVNFARIEVIGNIYENGDLLK